MIKRAYRMAVALFVAVFVCIPIFGLLGIDASQAMDVRKGGGHGEPRICSKTAQAAFNACGKELQDDYWITVGNCLNLSAAQDREACFKEAKYDERDAKELCADQREARLEVCDVLGEAPYDPDVASIEFVDFKAVLDGMETLEPNLYFPLVAGTTWIYKVKDSRGVVFESENR